MKLNVNAISMFSGGGIGETYLNDLGINIVVANEVMEKRAKFYSDFHQKTEMICGDIRNEDILKKIIEIGKKSNSKLLIATPPCQGMSTLGKKDYVEDERNYLVFYLLKVIDEIDLDYILIENVPKFLNLFFPYKKELCKIEDILKDKYSEKYIIETFVLNAMNYGIPQSRPRAIIKLYKKDLKWINPKEKKIISLKEAIGHLPSLESGESSHIKYHKALKHSEMHINVMKHTPEGKSAISNEIYYPKKKNGERIKGFHNTYKRMKWYEPCPTRALNNGAVSGHNNVHPGRPNSDGTWSDARVLTLYELLIVSSLPMNWEIPDWATESFVRQVIGEGVPPLLIKEILKGIEKR